MSSIRPRIRTKGRNTSLFLLLSISSLLLVRNAAAFNSRNILSISSKPVITASNYPIHYYNPRRIKLLQKGRTITQQLRPRRHHSGAATLAYPIGSSSLDASSSINNSSSWAEIITQGPTHETDVDPHDHVTTSDKLALGGAIVTFISLLSGLLKLSPPGSWRYFLAGGVCAALSHAIPTPIDVVKTRKQVDATLADKNFIKVSRDILKNEGMAALWVGLGPTIWGYLFEGAIKFGVYEALKPVIKNTLATVASSSTSLSFLNSQLLAFLVCGTASGLAASFMVCPMEALRIRMVADPEFSRGGMIAYGCKMLKREGTSGLAKGMTPMIMKQVPYTLTKNVSFDILTKFFYSTIRSQGINMSAGLTFTIPLISAGIASILSCISSHPGDMVLSVVNAHEGDRKPGEILRGILQSKRGIGGLFVGFRTRLLHVGIIVTIQLLVYDSVKRLLGIAATGSM